MSNSDFILKNYKMDQFPTSDEEFELRYDDDLELLREQDEGKRI